MREIHSDFLTVAAKSTHELNISVRWFNLLEWQRAPAACRWSQVERFSSQHYFHSFQLCTGECLESRAHLLIKYWYSWVWAVMVMKWEMICSLYMLKAEGGQYIYSPLLSFLLWLITVHLGCQLSWSLHWLFLSLIWDVFIQCIGERSGSFPFEKLREATLCAAQRLGY